MTDKSSGDFAARNSVKNPLLSTAATTFCLEDLTQSAVLLPVKNEQKSIDKQDNEPSKPEQILEPSKKPQQQPDDFDINEYFARLQCTGYVSAPIHSQPAQLASEEVLEEVNLNEQAEQKQQTTLKEDLQQNLQQLPQVLPQVANAVFNSFSNILNLGWDDGSKKTAGDFQQKGDVQQVMGCFVQQTPQSFSCAGNVDDGQMARPPMMYDAAGYQLDGTRSAVAAEKTAPPIGGTTNNFRLSAKKKTYAQIPGLTGQSTNLSANYIPHEAFPQSSLSQNNMLKPTPETSQLSSDVEHSLQKNDASLITSIEDTGNATDGSIWDAKYKSAGVLPPPQMFTNDPLQLGPSPSVATKRMPSTDLNPSLVPPSVARKLAGSQGSVVQQATPQFFLPSPFDNNVVGENDVEIHKTETLFDLQVKDEPKEEISDVQNNIQVSNPIEIPPTPWQSNTPATRTVEDICKPVPVEVKPLTSEPPKITTPLNFRLTNKRKPQYYSGPIDGGIPPTRAATFAPHEPAIPQPVEYFTPPYTQPVQTEAITSGGIFVGPSVSIAFTTVATVHGPPCTSQMIFTPAVSIAFTQSTLGPTAGNPQQPMSSTNDAPIMFNPSIFNQSQTQPIVPVTQYSTYNQDNIVGFPPPAEPQYQSQISVNPFPDSYDYSANYAANNNENNEKSDIFGTLKSKLGAVNINKLQNAVTTFFDPNYFDGNQKNVIEQTYDSGNNIELPINVYTNYLDAPTNPCQPIEQTTNYYTPFTTHSQNAYQPVTSYSWPDQTQFHQTQPVNTVSQDNNKPLQMCEVTQGLQSCVVSEGGFESSTSFPTAEDSLNTNITPANWGAYNCENYFESQEHSDFGDSESNADISSRNISAEREVKPCVFDETDEDSVSDMGSHLVGIPIPDRKKTYSEDELILETTLRPIDQLASYPSGPSDSEEHFHTKLKKENNPISFFDNFDAPSEICLGDNVKAAFEKDVEESNLTDKLIENLTSPVQYINPAAQPLSTIDDVTSEVTQGSTSDIDTVNSSEPFYISEKNSYGFIADNEDSCSSSAIPTNACDEIKAVLRHSVQEDEAKTKETLVPNVDEDRSESLDIQQIEADAKRDSLNCEEFTIEPSSETDDDKIENYRERSLDAPLNTYTLFGGEIAKPQIPPQTCTTTVAPVVPCVSYFDTGNYAAENSNKSNQPSSTIYGYEISSDAQNVNISQEKILNKSEPKAANPLASYFTTDSDRAFDSDVFESDSVAKPDHAKQFFQLSESQDHYQFSQNTKSKVATFIRNDSIGEIDNETEVIAVSIVKSCSKCFVSGEVMDSDGKDGGSGKVGDLTDGETGGGGFKLDLVSPEGVPSLLGDKMTSEVNAENPSEPANYKQQRHHWFYRCDTAAGRSSWKPFSMLDNQALEDAFYSGDLTSLVPTNGGRYDVNLAERTRHAVYWTEKPTNVRRCSWFYKGGSEGSSTPYSEATAAMLEEEYMNGVTSGEWHRRIGLTGGESVVLHGPNVMVHFPNTPSGTTQSVTRPRVVKRGFADFEIDEGEPRAVDHLLLLCHGIGSACDLRFRPVEEVVDEFRSMCLQLIRAHYKTSIERKSMGRIEVLPVSWHTTLHSGEDGVDKRMSLITLESIPRLRSFTNDTILDVLLYTSPVFCQTIMDTVGEELNRIVGLFKSRNPVFCGGVSLGGHSLGSLILFDLLCHQDRHSIDKVQTDEEKPSVGSAGTGQPFITYPRLGFEPDALFALGSPIGMFACVRGVYQFGEDFRLPTCPAFFNIFHPYDPIAYRIEPLINGELKELPPYLIPHHKGRKRMHLELKETVARVGADIRSKVLESLKSTWSSVFRPNMQEVIQEELTRSPTSTSLEGKTSVQQEELLSKKLGRLNMGRRIDYVLQEAPLELINEYLSAVTSHLCYWESEDTMLLILREIYGNQGIEPDQTLPAQTMSVEVERSIPTAVQPSCSRNS